MPEEVISEILALDASVLNPIVERILNDAMVQTLPDRNVDPIGQPSYGNGTLALLKCGGSAKTSKGVQNWSAVLKAVKVGEFRPGITFNRPEREIEVYGRGLFDSQGDGLRAARCYQVDQRPDGSTWMWLEDLSTYDGPPWTSSQYWTAAEHVGGFNASWHGRPLQDEPWLGRDQVRWRADEMDKHFGYSPFDVLAGLESSEYVRRAFPGAAFERALDMRDEMNQIRQALDGVPMTLAHSDYHVRNLFTSPQGCPAMETVAIDWASLSMEPLGTDPGTLFGSSLSWGDEEARVAQRLKDDVFNSYVIGLEGCGWNGSEAEARLGYLATACLYGGIVTLLPAWVAGGTPMRGLMLTRYGGSEEELPESVRERFPFVAGLFDETMESLSRM